MALLQKLLIAAVTSAATFLALGNFGSDTAQATLFKYTFKGHGAKGYFIYDDSVSAFSDNPITAAYAGAVVDYKIDLGDKGVFQGTTGTPIVFLVRQGEGITAPESDDLQFEIRGSDRQPASNYTLLIDFSYPKGTFGESLALPTAFPRTATATIYPYVDYPNTIGEIAFTGTVQTLLKKAPEPESWSEFLGLGVLVNPAS